MKNKIKKFLLDVVEITRKQEMEMLPAQLAFFIVLSIVPIITVMGVIGSFFNISIDAFTEVIIDYIPFEYGARVVETISGKGFDANIGILIFVIFFLASNGLYSVINASNTLYNCDNKYFIRRRIKSITMTVMLISLFIFILLVPTFGTLILNFLGSFINISLAFERSITIFNILKWPISILIIFLILKIIYVIAPDKPISSKQVNYGSLVTTLLWVIITMIYSYYVTHLANYDIFYGPLTNIITVMLWIYFLSYVFILGMFLNLKKYEEGNNNVK